MSTTPEQLTALAQRLQLEATYSLTPHFVRRRADALISLASRVDRVEGKLEKAETLVTWGIHPVIPQLDPILSVYNEMGPNTWLFDIRIDCYGKDLNKGPGPGTRESVENLVNELVNVLDAWRQRVSHLTAAINNIPRANPRKRKGVSAPLPQ